MERRDLLKIKKVTLNKERNYRNMKKNPSETNHSAMGELPLGLGMAFAQNPTAMARFTAMSETEKAAVIEKAHSVQSKQEMNALVGQLADESTTTG